jgi:hypothetical protein
LVIGTNQQLTKSEQRNKYTFFILLLKKNIKKVTEPGWFLKKNPSSNSWWLLRKK